MIKTFVLDFSLDKLIYSGQKIMKANYTEAELSEIIQMALSDHVSFTDIKGQYGLLEKDVVKIMRANLKKGSYKAWRKRVTEFGARREFYK
jgi:uncharacterized protein (TIGR03643 family)